MMRLGKYLPSLEFSAFEIRVSESQARYNFRSLEVSNFDNLDLGVSGISSKLTIQLAREATDLVLIYVFSNK